MASPNAYPKIGARPLAALRARAAAAPSTRFTPEIVATLLDMTPSSATANVLGPMRKLGLINDEGSLTPRGNKWRVDASYAEACEEILSEVYPPDLASFANGDGTVDRAGISTWLQHHGLGASHARQVSATYMLFADKTPPDPSVADGARETSRKASEKAPRTRRSTPAAERRIEPEPPGGAAPPSTNQGPVVHLDIQIHIPASADAEQIDQIFASMAKHLYQR